MRIGPARPRQGRARRRLRPSSSSSARSASTRSTPSSTSRRRRSSASPTAIPLSTFETNIARARGRCSRRAGAARRVRAIVVASSDKAYGDHDSCPYDEDAPLQGATRTTCSKSCADLIAQAYAHDLRTAGRDHPLRQLLRRRRPQLEPHRARHDPLRAPRRAPGDPLRRHARPRLLLRGGRRRGVHAPRRAARTAAASSRGEAFNFSNELQVTVIEMVALILGRRWACDLEPVIAGQRAETRSSAQYLDPSKARRACSAGTPSSTSSRVSSARSSGTGTFLGHMSAELRTTSCGAAILRARRRVSRARVPAHGVRPRRVPGAGLGRVFDASRAAVSWSIPGSTSG